MSLKKIKEILKKNDSFLITSHINLEGDSIGSQLAIYMLIKSLGKKPFILDSDKPPRIYNFLPHIRKISNNLTKRPVCDVNIVLDCPVIERTGKVAALLDKHKPVVNIDHHISNVYFGDVNWVEHNASSCGEMVYKLFDAMDQSITKEEATLLYVAILTDTGSFGYENTTASTHQIAKELIEKGLRPIEIYNRIYENRSMDELELLQKVLSTLKVVHSGKIAYLYVTRKMLKDSGCDPNVTEGFINYARSIEGVNVALLFLESPKGTGQIQISFRGKGEVNVNELASHFKGGGHRNAAGCVIKGDLGKVINKVLKAAKSEI